MYGICSNKALYSASLSFPMFIGPVAAAQWVLQNRACLSLSLSGCVTELDFFRKTSFAPNAAKMGQNWAKTKSFFEFIKKVNL